MNQKNLRLAVTVLAVAVTIAGCGDSATPAAAPTSSAPTGAAPTPAAAATPTASPSPTADPYAPRPFGRTVPVRDNIATAVVYAYRQPVAKTAPQPDEQPGYVWGAADVKVCATKASPGIIVTNGPWTLAYADDSQIEASSTGYQQFPQPGYPFGEKSLAAGRCIRGWITFPVPGGKRPVAVEYAPEGEPVAPRWTVK